MNWSDLRVFIALAQLGSLRQAALTLGVTQPTVARHIQELEADLGLPLFERGRKGHRLTVAGVKLLPVVRAVETAALRVEKRSLDLLNQLRETVRVGAGETAAAVLTRGLHNLTDGPNVELLVTGIASPIANRTPEILVQHGMPEEVSALTRRVGSVNCAIYGAPIFSEDHTLPLSDTVLTALPWLGFVEELRTLHYNALAAQKNAGQSSCGAIDEYRSHGRRRLRRGRCCGITMFCRKHCIWTDPAIFTD